MTYKLNVPVAGLTNNAQEFVVHVEIIRICNYICILYEIIY